MIKNPEIFSELYRENNKGVSYKIWKIQQKSETDLKPFQVFIVTKLFFNPEMKSGTLKIRNSYRYIEDILIISELNGSV